VFPESGRAGRSSRGAGGRRDRAEPGGPSEAPLATGPKGFRERRIASLFGEVLGVTVARADDDFFALGGDERLAARLLDVVAEDTGVRLPPGTVTECPTVRGLSRRVAGHPPTRAGRVFGYGTDLPGRPLFCLMPAFQARPVARRFNAAAGRPFYALQQSGLEGRARPDRTMARRVRRALADIRAVQPTGPYTIAGYSADSWIAFELSRRLRADGEVVDPLIVIDMWAPVYTRADTRRLARRRLWQLVVDWSPERGPWLDARRRALFLRELARDAAERAKWWMLGWTAGLVQWPSTKQTQVLFHLTGIAVSRYRPAPGSDDVVLVRAGPFGGLDWQVRRAEPDMSWSRVATGGVAVVPVAGDHISILEGEHACELGDALARLTGEAAAGRRLAGDRLRHPHHARVGAAPAVESSPAR